MILKRYLAREIIITYLAVVSVLMFVAISNHFASLLSKAATGALSLGLVVKIVALYVPEVFAEITPLAFFIGLLFALGRMYGDSEMVVFYSCGFKWSSVFKVILIISVIFSLIVGVFTLWIMPKSAVMREEAFNEGEVTAVIQTVIPGRFQDLSSGSVIFYVEDKDENNYLYNVFIAQKSKDKLDSPWTIITASRATITKKDNVDDRFFLVMDNGKRYTGYPGRKDYTVVNFYEYGREVVTEKQPLVDFDRTKPTTRLLTRKNTRSEDSELQWRFAVPLSIIVLALFGVSLARVSPRQGKFAKILPAILLYIVYYNIIIVSKRWIASGKITPWLGIWWVHLVFLAIGVLLLTKESGALFNFYYYKFKQKDKP